VGEAFQSAKKVKGQTFHHKFQNQVIKQQNTASILIRSEVACVKDREALPESMSTALYPCRDTCNESALAGNRRHQRNR